MKTILVTGGGGFIGQFVLGKLVDEGFEVHAISTKKRCDGQVNWHQADLLDRKQVEAVMASVKPGYLLHLAWYTEHGRYWKSEENLSWLQASIDLMRIFHQLGGERAVFAGSCAEYDWRYGLCDEKLTPLKPESLYGATKYALSEVLKGYSHEIGLSAAWARLFFLYGPLESPERFIPSMVRPLLLNQEAHCKNGNFIRDYLFVEDAADALVALLVSSLAGEVNIASGIPVTHEQIVRTIESEIGCEELARVDHTKKSADAFPVVCANIDRLRTELGWEPSWKLTDGIKKTVEWWRNETGN